jgi:hypothetical protein
MKFGDSAADTMLAVAKTNGNTTHLKRIKLAHCIRSHVLVIDERTNISIVNQRLQFEIPKPTFPTWSSSGSTAELSKLKCNARPGNPGSVACC